MQTTGLQWTPLLSLYRVQLLEPRLPLSYDRTLCSLGLEPVMSGCMPRDILKYLMGTSQPCRCCACIQASIMHASAWRCYACADRERPERQPVPTVACNADSCVCCFASGLRSTAAAAWSFGRYAYERLCMHPCSCSHAWAAPYGCVSRHLGGDAFLRRSLHRSTARVRPCPQFVERKRDSADTRCSQEPLQVGSRHVQKWKNRNKACVG